MAVLSVVVPVFQNADSLSELLDRLRRSCEGIAGFEVEYFSVDDGSTDGIFRQLAELAASNERIAALRLSRNFGSNAAVLAGLTYCRGDAVAVIAADLQDPPELIPEMVRHWQEGDPIVIAARQSRDDPPLSKLFATLFNRLFRLTVFQNFPRDGFDFVLLDRKIVEAVVAMPEKHSYLFGRIMWLGHTPRLIHYDRSIRAHGRSGWGFSKKAKYFLDAFTAFSYLPVRLASLAGLVLAGAGFVYAGFVIAVRLAGRVPERGFAALMVALLVISGTQLIVTGLIGEYLWRVLEEVRPRPPFVVASALNLSGTRPPRREGSGFAALLREGRQYPEGR